MNIDLRSFDYILVNSSAGKDSQAMLDEMFWQCVRAGVVDRMVVVHADLCEMEWKGTAELALQQAQCYGSRFVKVGRKETLLDYVLRRAAKLLALGKKGLAWPSSKARWCTSDFKRAPIRKVMTQLTDEARAKHGNKRVRILNCMGLRGQESPARAKKEVLTVSDASNGKREVLDYLPIHDWTETEVWDRIHESGVPFHPAYGLGMPRLSCVFCIFAPMSALMVAGKHNPELLDRYIEVEEITGHTFKAGFSLKQVRDALAAGVAAGPVESWAM